MSDQESIFCKQVLMIKGLFVKTAGNLRYGDIRKTNPFLPRLHW